MRQRRLAQIDLDTGEVIEDGQLVYQPAKRRNGFQLGGWLAMAQTPLDTIADDTRFTGETLRVLLKLCAKLDFENWVNVSQADLARQMGLKPGNFSRAITKLLAEGILLKGPSVGNRKTYRLDPAYGWKGSAKTHRAELNAKTRTSLELIKGGQR